MILRPRFRVLKGSHPVLLIKKKKKARQSKSNLTKRYCVFWPRWNCKTEVCTQEYYNELWILRGFISIQEMIYSENSLRNGQIISSSIITTLHATYCFWDVNFCQKKKIMVHPHPPYSPDLALWDFWLFLKAKRTMKDFELILDIEAAMRAQLKTGKRTSGTSSDGGNAVK